MFSTITGMLWSFIMVSCVSAGLPAQKPIVRDDGMRTPPGFEKRTAEAQSLVQDGHEAATSGSTALGSDMNDASPTSDHNPQEVRQEDEELRPSDDKDPSARLPATRTPGDQDMELLPAPTTKDTENPGSGSSMTQTGAEEKDRGPSQLFTAAEEKVTKLITGTVNQQSNTKLLNDVMKEHRQRIIDLKRTYHQIIDNVKSTAESIQAGVGAMADALKTMQGDTGPKFEMEKFQDDVHGPYLNADGGGGPPGGGGGPPGGGGGGGGGGTGGGGTGGTGGGGTASSDCGPGCQLDANGEVCVKIDDETESCEGQQAIPTNS